MATINQLTKNIRRLKKYRKKKVQHLKQCPQKKARCLRVFIMTPRKPNSALRKVAWVMIISTKKKIHAYIPGIGHTLKMHAKVLIRGGRVSDLPGMKYTMIRGAKPRYYDLQGLLIRRKSRSKYGAPHRRIYIPSRYKYLKYRYW